MTFLQRRTDLRCVVFQAALNPRTPFPRAKRRCRGWNVCLMRERTISLFWLDNWMLAWPQQISLHPQMCPDFSRKILVSRKKKRVDQILHLKIFTHLDQFAGSDVLGFVWRLWKLT